MSKKKCNGFVKLPNNKIRPCQQKSGAVLDNGFCYNHQNLAAKDLIKQLTMLKDEINYLKTKT